VIPGPLIVHFGLLSVTCDPCTCGVEMLFVQRSGDCFYVRCAKCGAAGGLAADCFEACCAWAAGVRLSDPRAEVSA